MRIGRPGNEQFFYVAVAERDHRNSCQQASSSAFHRCRPNNASIQRNVQSWARGTERGAALPGGQAIGEAASSTSDDGAAVGGRGKPEESRESSDWESEGPGS